MAATATAPADHRHEILSTEERDGERRHRYRWHVGDSSGEGTASEPIAPISRRTLEDRWNGLTVFKSDSTKLGDRLDAVLTDLTERLIRRDLESRAMIDGEIVGLDVVMDIDGLEDVMRDWLLERAGKVAAR